MSGQAPRVDKFSALLPATAAAADFVAVICEAPYAGTVTSVSYVADTAITGANTESRTVRVHNRGLAGAGTTVVASKAFLSGTNAAQYDETDITLSVVANATTVVAGDVLSVESLHVGATGLADPGGTVWLEITRS